MELVKKLQALTKRRAVGEFFIQVRSLVSIVSGHGAQQYIHMKGIEGINYDY
jgi:hypothetical protein